MNRYASASPPPRAPGSPRAMNPMSRPTAAAFAASPVREPARARSHAAACPRTRRPWCRPAISGIASSSTESRSGVSDSASLATKPAENRSALPRSGARSQVKRTSARRNDSSAIRQRWPSLPAVRSSGRPLLVGSDQQRVDSRTHLVQASRPGAAAGSAASASHSSAGPALAG